VLRPYFNSARRQLEEEEKEKEEEEEEEEEELTQQLIMHVCMISDALRQQQSCGDTN
jgi:hypothetical protein